MKKLIATVLSFVLGISILCPIQTEASANNIKESVSMLSLDKDNLTFLEGNAGDKYIVYTYETNGTIYKVEERINEDFTEVHSIIYARNTMGEFVEYAIQDTALDTNTNQITVTTNENGAIDSETQQLPTNNIQSLYRAGMNDVIMPFDSYNGYPVSNWWYDSWRNGSTRIDRYTVSSVVIVLTAIATASTAGTAAIVIGSIGGLATLIVGDQVPLVYYTQRYAEKTSLKIPNFVVGSRWETKWYLDSGRIYQTEYTVAEKFQQGYVGD